MQRGYFEAAWADITRSPHWFGRLLLLALIDIIPVFGWIYVRGYLFGWAREEAWSVKTSLPRVSLKNHDGLYRRGVHTLIISAIFLLVPWAVNGILEGIFALPSSMPSGWGGFLSPIGGVSQGLATVFSAMLFVCATVFAWVGCLRSVIYGRLSAGFQLGRIWAMLRHDSDGIVRVFGIMILSTIVAGFVVGALAVAFALSVVGAVLPLGFMDAQDGAAAAVMAVFSLWGCAAVFLLAALLLVGAVLDIFVQTLVIRALGRWAAGFEVSSWRGQDDPMPFELLDR